MFPSTAFIFIQTSNHPNITVKFQEKTIVCGGRMVLTFVGRSTFDPCSSGSSRVSELVVKSLVDAINEGLVRESDLYSLNVPLYYAYADEIRDIIHNQGSISLDILETFEINLDPYDTDYENVNVSDGEPKHGSIYVSDYEIIRAKLKLCELKHNIS
ncbi:benzoate carboxyl methyltransferase-like protein [Tanacetum coccineum]|uniref:Benzoate carboxyl methyltransferase-like protein n=1 Tax=Tanacetum coccineum TaxID=301880 RepID=A0ABQ5HEI5_9ASTR